MIFDRTVKAAVAETKSKFALAEALAIEIPPRKRGPNDFKFTITEYLMDAAAQIRRAGGEDRTWATLAEYRDTGLWVSRDLARNFQWIKGTSFSAHREAWRLKLTYDEFAVLPSKTVAAVRQYADRATPETRRAFREGVALELTAELWSMHQKMTRVIEWAADPAAIVSETQREAALEEIRWQRNALDLIEGRLSSRSVAEDAAEFLAQSDSQ